MRTRWYIKIVKTLLQKKNKEEVHPIGNSPFFISIKQNSERYIFFLCYCCNILLFSGLYTFFFSWNRYKTITTTTRTKIIIRPHHQSINKNITKSIWYDVMDMWTETTWLKIKLFISDFNRVYFIFLFWTLWFWYI